MKGKSDFLKEEMCRFFMSEIKLKAIDLIDLDQAIDQSVQVVECHDQKYLHRCHGSLSIIWPSMKLKVVWSWSWSYN